MNFRQIALPVLVLAVAGCDQGKSEKSVPKVETDADRYSYGLGMVIGERVLKQYDDVNYDLLLQGMMDQHQSAETQISLQDATEALNAYLEKSFAEQSTANKERGEAFLKSNAEMEGVMVTDSGLQYNVITQADGARPDAEDNVTVHYRGTLIDGTEFDSSYSRGEPTSFQLNQVIPGWTEGVQLMSVGSKYRFVIPHNLAYGERGAGGAIGPFETLIFEVELLDIGS